LERLGGSWPELQLVEVTGEYLESSDARFVQAVQEQLKIPENFYRCDENYAEAEVPGMDSTATSMWERK
jgi:hypothetical protein